MTYHALAVALAGLLAAPSLWSAAPPSPSEPVARGLLLLHQDTLIFAPCRERSYVAVDDASPDGEVSSTLKSIGLAPERPLYAELFGEAANGRMRVTAINFAHVEARCPAPRHTRSSWQAAGVAPAWRLTITEDRLRLQREGLPEIVTAFAEHDQGAGVSAMRAADDSDHRWVLSRGPCRDPASGIATGWAVEGSVGGAMLRGCAWKP